MESKRVHRSQRCVGGRFSSELVAALAIRPDLSRFVKGTGYALPHERCASFLSIPLPLAIRR